MRSGRLIPGQKHYFAWKEAYDLLLLNLMLRDLVEKKFWRESGRKKASGDWLVG